MANLKAIRKRIGSVKNMQQITKAMKMVATAKLRRAQESLMQGRPYAIRLVEMIQRLVQSVDANVHPLLKEREGTRTLILIVTSDKGLCGGFNTNVNREAESFLRENRKNLESVDLAFVGRKGQEFFKRRARLHNANMTHYFKEVFDGLSVEKTRVVSDTIIEDFLDNKYDQVFLLYNQFKSVISQEIIFEKLLPIVPKELESSDNDDNSVEYEYEPKQAELFEHLLPLHINTQIFRALRESIAAEMGARMAAMESATKNATELIDKLTIELNRIRQAVITTELIEIISAAEAL